MIIETPHESENLFSFVVKRTGAAAWIMVPNESIEKQVWKADRTNVFEREQLDAGDNIVPESLRLSSDRRTVTWENGSTDKSAPLD